MNFEEIEILKIYQLYLNLANSELAGKQITKDYFSVEYNFFIRRLVFEKIQFENLSSTRILIVNQFLTCSDTFP